MNPLLNKIAKRYARTEGVVEKALKDGRINDKQYKQILEVRKSWQNGEIAVGSGAVAEEILIAFGVELPRTTLNSWLGKKGKNVTKK